jgi:hypothetical protein
LGLPDAACDDGGMAAKCLDFTLQGDVHEESLRLDI